MIQALREDRDLARATLKQHGLEVDKHTDVCELNSYHRCICGGCKECGGGGGIELYLYIYLFYFTQKAFLLANDELSLAQQQNLNLRNVISQMRQQMELLQDQIENQKQTVTNGIDKGRWKDDMMLRF